MTSEGDRAPEEIGCGTMLFRALVALDLLVLAAGWITVQQPMPSGMDVGPGPGLAGILALVVAVPLGVALFVLWATAGHANPESVRAVFGLVLVVTVVAVVAGSGIWSPKPNDAPKGYYRPEHASPIDSIYKQWDSSYRLVLADADIVDISGGFIPGSATPGPSVFVAPGPMPEFRVGDLLLAGHKPHPWFMIAASQPGGTNAAGCYLLEAEAADRGDHFELSPGVWLDKADQFASGSQAKLGTTFRWLCLDGEGRVTSAG